MFTGKSLTTDAHVGRTANYDLSGEAVHGSATIWRELVAKLNVVDEKFSTRNQMELSVCNK